MNTKTQRLIAQFNESRLQEAPLPDKSGLEQARNSYNLQVTEYNDRVFGLCASGIEMDLKQQSAVN